MSGTLVVMQPTFLPWAGYFNLMAEADDFVFHDDAQLEKQSWHTRNRLILNGQPQWIIVPVQRDHWTQRIVATQVLDITPWRAKLARVFALSYGKHPYYEDANEVIELLVNSPITGMAALNELIISHVAARLGLSPRMHRASELNISGIRSDRLIAFCAHFRANEYLSPRGSAAYLAEDHFAERSPARLRFQDYISRPYPQRGMREFVSHLSILDLVANVGWKMAREYVVSSSSA